MTLSIDEYIVLDFNKNKVMRTDACKNILSRWTFYFRSFVSDLTHLLHVIFSNDCHKVCIMNSEYRTVREFGLLQTQSQVPRTFNLSRKGSQNTIVEKGLDQNGHGCVLEDTLPKTPRQSVFSLCFLGYFEIVQLYLLHSEIPIPSQFSDPSRASIS
jgi:hypothetical protein